MSLSVRVLDHAAALRHLAEELHGPSSSAGLRTAIVAEHIRTLVSAPFAAMPREHPIHTARLIGALNRNVRFLAANADEFDDLEEAFTFVRDQLAVCGDIAHAGNGYWIPCPMRVLRIDPNHVYLFGGAPLPSWARHVPASIAAMGPSRYVQAPGLTNLPTLTLAQWLEHDEPLAVWTERTLTRAAVELVPQADIEDDTLEIYAPDLYRTLQRSGFWAPAREFHEAAPSLRLFRPKTTPQWTFDRPDYLGVFHKGRQGAQLLKAVRIEHDVARRLQFGLDLRYRTARTLILRRAGECYRLEVKFPPFPEPESRVLGMGWREPKIPDALLFAPSALPVLRGVVELLRMRLYHA